MIGFANEGSTWFVAESCSQASRFGWVVGAASGTLVDLVIIATIVQARRLNKGTPTDWMAESKTLHTARLVVSLFVPLLWLISMSATWGPWSSCSLVSLSGAIAIMVGGICLLVMFTAANQIAVRSVR